MKLIKISPCLVGGKLVGYYFLHKVKVQRGIKGKSKSKVEELLIYGVPLKDVPNYYKDHKEEIDYYYMHEEEILHENENSNE